MRPHPEGTQGSTERASHSLGSGTGRVYIGETKRDFYAEFASVLDYQLFLPTKREDL